MNLFALTTLATSILSFALAIFVIRREFRAKLNIAWFMVGFSVGLWSFGFWGVIRAGSELEATFFQYLLDIGAILTPISYFRFIVVLLNIEKKKKRELFLTNVIGAILIALSFFPIFKLGVEPVQGADFNYWVIPGPVYYVFPIIFLFLSGYSVFLGLKHYKTSKGFLKSQIIYVLLAGLIGFAGGATNFFPQVIDTYPIGNYFVIFYILAMAYAIARFRLMGIKFIASKIYIYLIVAIFTYIYFQYLLYVHLLVLSGRASLVQLTIFDLASSIIFAVALLPFLNYIQKSSDILFFRGHNPRKLIKELSVELSGVIDLKQLTETLTGELKKLISTEAVKVVLLDHQFGGSKRGRNLMLYTQQRKLKRESLSAESKILETVRLDKKIIVIDEIDIETIEGRRLIKEMRKHDVSVVAPLKAYNKLVGMLLLGPKLTQDTYSREDIEFVEIISSQAAVAVENSRLYAEIKAFNTRLKQEVKNATSNIEDTNKELTQANLKLVYAYEKLHKLDRAKSEFLSIASHQLRTPLTSIKGFTSLLLEGTYGKISVGVKTVLEKVYLSNERLIHLVEDLLNISRIESGRFVFDLKENDISQLMNEVIDSFAVPVKNKKLKLEYVAPKKNVPDFVFDRNKLRELLSNLIDNAVKYTQKGSIKISMKVQPKKVLIAIKDSGMGIPKGETEYIFDKFQRGKGVMQVHTEGVGLGLYVCKKVIEAHRGRIWAESTGSGKGSTFFVELNRDFKPKLSKIQQRRIAQKKQLKKMENKTQTKN